MAVVDAHPPATGASGGGATVAPAREPAAGDPEPAELRRQMAEDGYVVVRHAVPPADAGAVREAVAEVLQEAGLVRAGPDGTVLPTDPAARVDVHTDRALFPRLYGIEALHRLPHHPRLRALAAALLDLADRADQLLVHPRPAIRVVFPGTPGALAATPAHQDLLGMQGTPDAYTAWVALTPCSRVAGVLAVAAGSHRSGLRPYAPSPGARVAGCEAGDLDGSWVAADLAPGDAIVFHSLTVHRALPNGPASVRLSLDARYQRVSDPVSAATVAERPDLPWDRLYEGWSEEGAPYRRYWERLPLDVVPFDPSRLARPAAPPAATPADL